MEIKTKNARRENYSCGRSKPIRYIVIHYTGNYGDTAEKNAEFFGRESVKPSRSAHFFVDENAVWQSVPPDSAAWHVSSSAAVHSDCRNSNSIGVEICMLDKQGEVRRGSVDRAVQLTRELMRKYGIPAERVLRHYDVIRKSCPEPMVRNPDLWRDFLDRLKGEDDMKYYENLAEIPAGEMRDTVRMLMDRQVIAGNGSGLHLSEDMVRVLVWLRRLGVYQ